jgi:UDP-N-acetylmuramoylalanine--D-glutamate ligase
MTTSVKTKKEGTVIILGAGESGTGAAILAKQKGYTVFLSDKGAIKDEYKQELYAHGIAFEENQHTIERILLADIVIKSPGIPDKVALIQDLKSRKILVISEIEFASWFTKVPVIGITGSNGKTTTTMLTYHLLHTADIDVKMGGNIGVSFARLVAEEITHTPQYYVIELSSFQLDGIENFRPHIAILLNITPDHLDRYEYNMDYYIASKFRITLNQKRSDTFIYNIENEAITYFLKNKEIRAKCIEVGTDFYKNGQIIINNSTKLEVSKSSLRGMHNYFNATCAIHAARLVGASKEGIQEGLNTFKNVPHRLEFVTNTNGIDYINDSKATNVDSVFYALGAMEKPTILILGGQDKGNDYSAIADLVRQKVKAIVAMGVDNRKILDYFATFNLPIADTHSMIAALDTATHFAQSGDAILLSPACASFDLFKNYEDRGAQFKEYLK